MSEQRILVIDPNFSWFELEWELFVYWTRFDGWTKKKFGKIHVNRDQNLKVIRMETFETNDGKICLKSFFRRKNIFFFFLNILKVAIDDRKRKFLKGDPRGSIIVMRVFRGSCTLPDSSCLWFVRSMGRCEWGTHFSTHASLEFFSLASIQKVSFSVVQSSLHDLRSRLYSNNNSTRIRMNISKISTYWLEKKKDQKSNKF